MLLVKPVAEFTTPPDRDLIYSTIECAARVAYQSESKGNAASFVSSLWARKHYSPFEHVSLTARLLCDRGVSHELVRHRLCTFTQESTRYCGYDTMTFVIPPWVPISPGEYNHKMSDTVPEGEWFNAMLEAEHRYVRLRFADRWKPEMARGILPMSLATMLTMTANLREWMYILHLRCSAEAHPQMVELMTPLKHQLQIALPEIFA